MPKKPDLKPLNVLRTVQEMSTLKEYLSDKEFIAYDCESTGVVKGSEIIGYSVSAEIGLSFYVVVAEWSVADQKLVYLETKEHTAEFLRSLLTKKLIMHNAIFDSSIARDNYGVDLMPAVFCDTMLLAHLLDENRHVGLKELAVSMFGEDSRQEQLDMKASVAANGGVLTRDCYELYKASSELIGLYGAKDTDLTLRVFYTLLPQLFEQKLDAFFFDDETMPLLRGPTYELNTVGLRVDPERLQKLKLQLQADCAEALAFITKEIEPYVKEVYPGTSKAKTFNIGSSGQRSWLLFWNLKEEFGTLTDEGKTVCEWLGLDIPYTLAPKREFMKKCEARKGEIYCPAKKNYKTGKMGLPKKIRDGWYYVTCGKESLGMYSDKYRWVAKYLEYAKNLKLLNTYVEGIQERARYNIIRPSFLQHGTTSGRYASRNPNCLSLDTEVLTDSGFKRHHQLNQEDKIACYSTNTKKLAFEVPEAVWVSDLVERTMIQVKNEHLDLSMTENHRCLFRRRKTKEEFTVPASEFRRDAHVLHGAVYNGPGVKYSSAELRLIVAAQADSEIREDTDTVRFVFSKKRKYERLLSLLAELPYRILDTSTSSRFEVRVYGSKQFLLGVIGKTKTFPSTFLAMTTAERSVFLEELWYWDGLSTRKNNYSSNNEANVDIIQALMALHGWRAHKREYWSKLSKSPNFQLDVSRRDYSGTANVSLSTKTEVCQVWCVKTSTGYFVARRGADTFITGNCQNMPRDDKRIKECFVSRPGKVFVGADQSQLEPRVFASISQDATLLKCFKDGDDFYSVIGSQVFGKYDCHLKKDDTPDSFPVKYKSLRELSKVIALATPYGTSAFQTKKSLATKRIVKSIDECKQIIADYFEAYPSVHKMMLDAHEEVKNKGVIYSIYGRPRRIPKGLEITEIYGKMPHERLPYEIRTLLNLGMNHCTQSGGASIMNRSAIKYCRDRDAAGLVAPIVCQVHDSLIVECDEKDAPAVSKLLQTAMEEAVILPGVKLEAIPKIGLDLSQV